MRLLFVFCLCIMSSVIIGQSSFTIVEFNTENLFDTVHDSISNDYEFLPNSPRHWNSAKYWRKLNRIGQEIIACGDNNGKWQLPDIIGLCEVENDTVLRDLTKRSLLRKAKYEYIMTASKDGRGIDVAFLYSPLSFRFLKADTIKIIPIRGMKLTRDILKIEGEIESGDTLHVYLVHAPSRRGGELYSKKFREHVARVLCHNIDSTLQEHKTAKIIVLGDFNDYYNSSSLMYYYQHSLINVSKNAIGKFGAKGTYRYKGEWGSLDHILVSASLIKNVDNCIILDNPFLLEDDNVYGGVKPKRYYNGMRFNNGFSDHLPIVLRISLSPMDNH